MAFILSIVIVFLLLVGSELYWRKRGLHDEFSRKLIHITVGSYVAFWPYMLSARQIQLLSAAFLVIVAISKYFNLFSVIHSVQRPTWGELWFALVVGLLSFTLHHPHIYTAALLEMSLADGMAAVIGTRYGKRLRYSVFGSAKSLEGTLTFFVISCLILSGYALASHMMLVAYLIIPISLGATLLENVAVRGSDNLVVPLYMAVVLIGLT